MSKTEKAEYNEKKKVAAQAYKQRQNEAKATVKEFLAQSPDIPEEVKKAIEYLAGSGKRVARQGVKNLLREKLLEAGSMSGTEIFAMFEYGTPAMKNEVRKLIKDSAPEERLWVAYEAGNWVVKGEGPDAPEGWDGYMPPEKAESEEL